MAKKLPISISQTCSKDLAIAQALEAVITIDVSQSSPHKVGLSSAELCNDELGEVGAVSQA